MRVHFGPALLHGNVNEADKRLDDLQKWIATKTSSKTGSDEAWKKLQPYACFGLEAMLTDWLGSTLANEERLKSISKEAKIDWTPVRVEGGGVGDVASGGMSTQILQVREILGARGEEIDDGFLQEVLKSFHGNMQEAIVALMHPEGEGLPDHLKFLYTAKEVKLLDRDKGLREFWDDPQSRGQDHAQDKARVLEMAESFGQQENELERARAEAAAEARMAQEKAAADAMYDDEYDDTFDGSRKRNCFRPLRGSSVKFRVLFCSHRRWGRSRKSCRCSVVPLRTQPRKGFRAFPSSSEPI